MEDVLFKIHDNGIAEIILNRPKALNSLNTSMLLKMKEKILAWQDDTRVSAVLLSGSGEKGFCAGGDIKKLYAAKDSDENMKEALEFFDIEYEVDLLVSEFNKPIVAILDGIVMGGGVGLSYGASHRIITEKTKWAMPEMNIGFFPDVGAAYFLNQAPGYIGRYLALTSEIIRGEDIVYSNAVQHYIPSDRLPQFKETLLQADCQVEKIYDHLDKIIQEYAEPINQEKSNLANLRSMIDEHFRHESVETIIESLTNSTDEFSVNTKNTILEKSPTSLKVTLAQLIKGEGQSFKTCLETDKRIVKNFLNHADFYEGVRSVIIDKGQNPKYQYKQLSDVSGELVKSFFV
ncbi:enoyl-CoA hydratase/isomerase family protein [Virgibacillus alimentarius]|uniref:3-hydroxyisobutyryl-CoA hydrolase n=1 Tax=Virgibacillus alimentarius TaxID=698769 RepID=A0ABS4S779_9BACI|nr:MULTISPECIES: enoyl-CoA hydratase/isomerase family protein [Virgibacillus]MBP2257335.1 enoyl-CoA hydratase/carnithine racemase [Virgibacillus alimentarius]HLR68640.1 enoyl-CoA hydratase/isomerase family protein [Virgibacillus sp.]